MDLILKIESVQDPVPSSVGHRSTFEVIARGSFIEDGFRIFYRETATSGVEGTVTCLDIFSDHIELKRSGSVRQETCFKINSPCAFLYHTPYGPISMRANTQKLEISYANQLPETILLTYELLSDEGKIADCQLQIHIQEADDLNETTTCHLA